MSSDFPSPRNLGDWIKAKKEQVGNGRGSLSSISTSNDHNEGSGYSTPGTSAAATPALGSKPSTQRRGRRPATMTSESSTPAVNAVARAAALRNSQFSLNASSKRKRVADSEDDDEEIDADEEMDADEDDSPDAQLARAMQEQEYANADSMVLDDDDDEEVLPRRRTQRRSARKLLPKTDFVSDFDDDLLHPEFSPKLAKRPKIELGSKGSNAVSFSQSKGNGKAKVVDDSLDSDDFIELEDSDEASDADIPLSTSKGRNVIVRGSSKATRKSTKTSIPTASGPNVFDISEKVSSSAIPGLQRQDTKATTESSALSDLDIEESEYNTEEVEQIDYDSADASDDSVILAAVAVAASSARTPRRSLASARHRINRMEDGYNRRGRLERKRLETHHPVLQTMWKDLENLPKIGDVTIEQPKSINRELKPFQLQGVAWMIAMEKTAWGGGLLGDEMGMGKTIQAVSLIMSDWPAKQPSLVLIPPVAIMQWQQEIKDYTDGTLKTFVYHGTNTQVKDITYVKLMKYDVILMSYNSLESMYRKQEKGFTRKGKSVKEDSIIHMIRFHRVILDEAHSIKVCCAPWFYFLVANFLRLEPLVRLRLALL